MSSALRVVLIGIAGSMAAAAAWGAGQGVAAARAAAIAGLLATAAQTVAHVWQSGVPAEAPASAHWRRHLHGTALRFGTAAVMVALVVKDRDAFPPLATVLTLAGVLFGLLALEIRSRA